MDIKKGDTVEVMSGNDRGRRSTVLSVIRDKDRVLVEGVNMRKHHTRPSQRDIHSNPFSSHTHRGSHCLLHCTAKRNTLLHLSREIISN